MLIYLSMIECEIERKSSDVLRAKKHTISTDFEASDPGIEMPQHGGGGLADAIAKLKPSYREAILLHYAYGYKINELARMSHIQTQMEEYQTNIRREQEERHQRKSHAATDKGRPDRHFDPVR